MSWLGFKEATVGVSGANARVKLQYSDQYRGNPVRGTALVRGTRHREKERKDQAGFGLMERMSVTGRRGDAVFALCVDSGEYPESLQPQKFYRVLPDRNAERYDEVRVVDDSGEDYLYPAEYFLPIEPPKPREVASPRAFLANLDVIRGRRLTG